MILHVNSAFKYIYPLLLLLLLLSVPVSREKSEIMQTGLFLGGGGGYDFRLWKSGNIITKKISLILVPKSRDANLVKRFAALIFLGSLKKSILDEKKSI